MLDRDRVRVGVEIGQGLVLGDPAAEDAVREGELARLVVDLDDDVLAEVRQRGLDAEAGAEVPDLVRPPLELEVVRDAALEGDRLELRPSRRLSARARVASFSVLDHLGGALEHTYFAHPGHVFAIPLDAKLEVFIRIEALWINSKLCHNIPLYTWS